MAELVTGIGTISAERKKVATGVTLRSITTEVNSIAGVGLQGRMSANTNWRYVGNGRGPGRMPPVDNIRRWIEARGLSLSAWAVAKRIAREGSKDHRQGNANVFEQGIAEWQSNESLIAAADEVAAALADTVVVDLQTGLR